MAALIRELTYAGDEGDVKVAVIVGESFASGGDWGCRYDIRWPDGGESGTVYGVDAIQAVELTFRTIGALIYTSDAHRSGNLFWEKPGQGYGFPVPNTIRDLLIGDDARFFG